MEAGLNHIEFIEQEGNAWNTTMEPTEAFESCIKQ